MKRRLKVLFDFEAFSDQSRGGVSRYVIELASRLAGEVEIHLAAGFHRNLYARAMAQPWLHGAYVAPLRFTGELRRRINAALTRHAIGKFRPDIVHRTYYRHAGLYPGPHREIVTLYDFTYFLFPGHFPGGEVVRRNMKRVAGEVATCISISTQTRNDALATFGGDPVRHVVIPLGVRPAATPRGNAPLPSPYLLFVGDRAGYKDFAVVLEAMARSDALGKLSLLALGGGALRRDEVDAIARHGLAGRVHQRSADDNVLTDAYRHACATVYPSRYEGFGLPVLEAMTHGCPVVASDAAALKETGGTAAEFFNTGDAASLAAAITRAALPGARHDELRRLGPPHAARFSWERCAQSTLQVYQRVAGSPR